MIDCHVLEFIVPLVDQHFMLNPFEIIVHLTFWLSSLTTRLIQKLVPNITSFVVACLLTKVL